MISVLPVKAPWVHLITQKNKPVRIIVPVRILVPVRKFFSRSSSGALFLFVATLAALLISNSFLAEHFEALWRTKMGFTIGNFSIYKPLRLWINDGLMSVFFFVVGLELKREIVAGELSDPRNAVVPFIAGLGGMLLPALIFLWFNYQVEGEAINGWGIPMATDIAFALGVIYLLGDRVPLSLRIFLTALAIIDDIGAVLVIAFFYTSEISMSNIAIGAGFLTAMALGNLLGVRNTLFYGILGIAGLWLAFLLSGVHATIAAVLAAFTIPSNFEINKEKYIRRTRFLMKRYMELPKRESLMLAEEQYQVLEKMRRSTDRAVPPLQKLEHNLHDLTAYIVLPIFALANAGVEFSGSFADNLGSSISLGIAAGLIFGKVIGITGFIFIAEKLRVIRLSQSLTYPLIIGTAFLAAIGFTMSLFITSLAYEDYENIDRAKVGILSASVIAGSIGYLILNRVTRNRPLGKTEVDMGKGG